MATLTDKEKRNRRSRPLSKPPNSGKGGANVGVGGYYSETDSTNQDYPALTDPAQVQTGQVDPTNLGNLDKQSDRQLQQTASNLQVQTANAVAPEPEPEQPQGQDVDLSNTPQPQYMQTNRANQQQPPQQPAQQPQDQAPVEPPAPAGLEQRYEATAEQTGPRSVDLTIPNNARMNRTTEGWQEQEGPGGVAGFAQDLRGAAKNLNDSIPEPGNYIPGLPSREQAQRGMRDVSNYVQEQAAEGDSPGEKAVRGGAALVGGVGQEAYRQFDETAGNLAQSPVLTAPFEAQKAVNDVMGVSPTAPAEAGYQDGQEAGGSDGSGGTPEAKAGQPQGGQPQGGQDSSGGQQSGPIEERQFPNSDESYYANTETNTFAGTREGAQEGAMGGGGLSIMPTRNGGSLAGQQQAQQGPQYDQQEANRATDRSRLRREARSTPDLSAPIGEFFGGIRERNQAARQLEQMNKTDRTAMEQQRKRQEQQAELAQQERESRRNFTAELLKLNDDDMDPVTLEKPVPGSEIGQTQEVAYAYQNGSLKRLTGQDANKKQPPESAKTKLNELDPQESPKAYVEHIRKLMDEGYAVDDAHVRRAKALREQANDIKNGE